VEQNAKLALGLGDRAYILKSGRIALSGNTKDLLNDENVQKAYLGGGAKN
jgi:branched-chain amino acid transport system ATP-binding protein